MDKISVIISIYGLVQGVGFRYHTQNQAKLLGVKGYVRNLDDGSVEIVASGAQRQIDKLVAWLQLGGPKSAQVERVVCEPCEYKDYQEFIIRY